MILINRMMIYINRIILLNHKYKINNNNNYVNKINSNSNYVNKIHHVNKIKALTTILIIIFNQI